MTTDVLMFPGLGAQHAGMGRALFGRYPRLTERVCDLLDWDLRRVCLHNPDGSLDLISVAEPAVYVVNALAYRAMRADEHLYRAWPAVVLGHGVGEFNALEAAGALDFFDGLRLVVLRAELSATVSGAMCAVSGLSESRIREVLSGSAGSAGAAEIAYLDAPRQAVVAGSIERLRAVQAAFVFAGASGTRILPVDAPLHSRRMAVVAQAWAGALRRVRFGTLGVPVVANHTGRPYEQHDCARLLREHLSSPVRWSESIRWIIENHRDARFQEAGARGALSRLLGQISPEHAPYDSAPTGGVAFRSAGRAGPVEIKERDRN